MGYDLSDSLSVDGSVKALKMTLSKENKNLKLPLLHHSNKGLQYCSNGYQNLLKESGIKSSMTE